MSYFEYIPFFGSTESSDEKIAKQPVAELVGGNPKAVVQATFKCALAEKNVSIMNSRAKVHQKAQNTLEQTKKEADEATELKYTKAKETADGNHKAALHAAEEEKKTSLKKNQSTFDKKFQERLVAASKIENDVISFTKKSELCVSEYDNAVEAQRKSVEKWKESAEEIAISSKKRTADAMAGKVLGEEDKTESDANASESEEADKRTRRTTRATAPVERFSFG